MKDSKEPKPVTRLKPRRVKLVCSTYQPSNAELEESTSLPPCRWRRPPAGSWNRSRFTTSTSPGARARPDAFWALSRTSPNPRTCRRSMHGW